MGRRVAVVGAGMTKFVRRAQETGKELAWEAARAALGSCELTLDQIDANTVEVPEGAQIVTSSEAAASTDAS